MDYEQERISMADDMKEKERLTTIAKSMTESLLKATDLLGGVPWCLVQLKQGISLFRANVGNDVPCNVHAVCKFTSDIDDVAESMITNTTESYKNMMSMLSSDFIDGSLIQNIVEPTKLNPHRYVALKWAAFKNSSRFGKDRDFIILEYVDMIKDDQGQQIAFRVMASVDVPNNSAFAESSKYTRDIVPLMGFMYHTTKKPNELRLTYTCNFESLDLPEWVANSAIQCHVEKCIAGNLKYIENFRAAKEEIVLPQQVIPMSEQDHCHICEKDFMKVVRRKYHCLKCGEVICSNCSSIRNAIVPTVGERQLRVCTACVIAARRTSKSSESSGQSSPGASQSPSTTTVDTDPMQNSMSSSSTGSTRSLCRTHSFTHGKRRSFDNLLDPVRNRLIEHKVFSNEADAVSIPKASFPGRSFSDGLVMSKDKLFGAKRRGSPADLAISLEAFRQHRIRMGSIDLDDDNDDESDEETMHRLHHFSSTSSESTSPRAHRKLDETLATLHSAHPVVFGADGRMRPRKHLNEVSNQSAAQKLNATSASSPTASRSKLDEAMERARGIIEAAEYANTLAQHARKVSHHRIIALQREHHEMMGISSSDKNSNDGTNDTESYEGAEATQHESPTRVRRTVGQTKNGTVSIGSKQSNAVTMDGSEHVMQSHVRSNQWVDDGFRRHHVSNHRGNGHYY